MNEETILILSANKAAFLLCNGVEYISIGNNAEGMKYFEFPINKHVQNVLDQYYKPETAANLAISNFIRQYWLIRDLMKSA